MKMQIIRQIFSLLPIGGTLQGAYQKIPKKTALIHHQKGAVKEFRENDEIHRDIPFPRGKNLLCRLLVQKKEIAGLQNQPCAFVDDVGGGSAAHVDNFNIVVPVSGKMHKAGVRPDVDQLSRIQHLPAVHDEFIIRCIQTFLNPAVPGKNSLFLRRNPAQTFQKLLIHIFLPAEVPA